MGMWISCKNEHAPPKTIENKVLKRSQVLAYLSEEKSLRQRRAEQGEGSPQNLILGFDIKALELRKNGRDSIEVLTFFPEKKAYWRTVLRVNQELDLQYWHQKGVEEGTMKELRRKALLKAILEPGFPREQKQCFFELQAGTLQKMSCL